MKAVTVTSLIPTTTYHMTTIQSKPQPITPEKTQETEPSITKTATSHLPPPTRQRPPAGGRPSPVDGGACEARGALRHALPGVEDEAVVVGQVHPGA